MIKSKLQKIQRQKESRPQNEFTTDAHFEGKVCPDIIVIEWSLPVFLNTYLKKNALFF